VFNASSESSGSEDFNDPTTSDYGQGRQGLIGSAKCRRAPEAMKLRRWIPSSQPSDQIAPM
jgi:hypothetical protein